ncbi:MAG: DUF881 domain-containing protein [Caldicoprobacterales bacterium]
MKKTRGGQAAILLVCLILGLALASQFKNVQNVGGSVSLQRTQELTSEIQKLNQEIAGQQQLIMDLERMLHEYENAAKDDGDFNDTMYKELERSRVLAGLTELEGPGIIVTIDVVKINSWYDESTIIRNVYHDDLLLLVNELNAAGAEAISINDERIISTSEIRNAGDFIVINTNRYSTPFVIKAIGNPDTLEASLKLLGGVADSLGEELEIKIQREEKLKVAKFNGYLQFRHAKPVQ